MNMAPISTKITCKLLVYEAWERASVSCVFHCHLQLHRAQSPNIAELLLGKMLWDIRMLGLSTSSSSSNPNISKPFTASRVFRRSGDGVISATSVASSLGTGHPHTPIRGRCSCASSANNQSLTDLSQVLLSWILTRSHGGSASRRGHKGPQHAPKLRQWKGASWGRLRLVESHHIVCLHLLDKPPFKMHSSNGRRIIHEEHDVAWCSLRPILIPAISPLYVMIIH